MKNLLRSPFTRSLYRILTYSLVALSRERRALKEALANWKGHHLFLFPYLNRGGAEQVHADILASVKDQAPLAIMTGFSTDRGMAQRFAASATVLELPRLLNHPFTRKAAERAIADHLNAQRQPVLFSSLTTTFFKLLPLLRDDVRTIWLQHAFLFQPEGNAQHKAWLKHVQQVGCYAFVSLHAKAEFEKFLVANGVKPAELAKLIFMPNAVHGFGEVKNHERIGLLFVGRDSAEKRLPIFLSLAQRLEREHPGRFHFTVVGPPMRMGLAKVHFAGPIDDPTRLAELYTDHDVLVVTSSREGFPMVVMEAMANGLVVMSTPVGDVPARTDASCAVIATTIDPASAEQEFHDAIIQLDGDRTRLKAMKQAALTKAKTEFGMDAFRERYRALLINPASEA